ncbi:uncharacterized protein N7473_011099 [Penicillium subrubescens]|uniref:uncharacterized protein n=1 Tax=Penicillium subrubescens TaxID=1316194 RepID=UPI0025454EAF|nr:uncharacterized protein N7473_011099 [Penicillium subrubescens]KAJ5882837.1 hypothetical protein N7473_011099 [Penicillium subrubescens]
MEELESCSVYKDGRLFILAYKEVIEFGPLQVSASALVFSPSGSPKVEINWNACLQTLEGHGDNVTSVIFSNDGQRLTSELGFLNVYSPSGTFKFDFEKTLPRDSSDSGYSTSAKDIWITNLRIKDRMRFGYLRSVAH